MLTLLAAALATEMAVEPFDLEWTWAIFLGVGITVLVICLIFTKR